VTDLFTCVPVSVISALPVPHVKPGFFLGLVGCLFPPLFFFGSLEVPGGPFGSQWLNWVPIWEPFGSLLGYFLEVGGSLVFDTPLQR